MKKLVVLIIPILLLTACTSNEEDKIAYLEYKNELEKQETFSPEDELDFNVYFNISKEGEEITNYSILINNPKVNMHKVKALLIHNYIIDEAYPSIGIMDKPVELLKDNNNKIELKGKIQTSENISNVKYKLYIEYTTDDGKENKIIIPSLSLSSSVSITSIFSYIYKLFNKLVITLNSIILVPFDKK